jgi:hypothetical protein
VQVFPGSPSSSVQCLAWTKGSGRKSRLFAGGLHGKLFELSLATFTVKASRDSHGGAVWSLAVNAAEDQLAIGCEDGFVRIFRVDNDELEFSKALPGSNGAGGVGCGWGGGVGAVARFAHPCWWLCPAPALFGRWSCL